MFNIHHQGFMPAWHLPPFYGFNRSCEKDGVPTALASLVLRAQGSGEGSLFAVPEKFENEIDDQLPSDLPQAVAIAPRKAVCMRIMMSAGHGKALCEIKPSRWYQKIKGDDVVLGVAAVGVVTGLAYLGYVAYQESLAP